ncbi:unnamed protein product [Psylliodes chrysocephalus]|uniref:Alpha-and gamma-adaptin-binding protein p34 n=1 Tax=Psylliodes chrysocephalus TaxID=3402493 RepID=A0A9P0CV28_9CUCU|nr:unnamed protein product [Psylliodes chrysocephala]
MNNQPGIVIVSCSKTRPKSLIKLITKTQQIDENDLTPGLIMHPWNIDTKYYTAKVSLLGIETDVAMDKDVISSIEAVIIHMDSNNKTGLEDLKKWDFLDNDYNVDVKLLLANYCNDNTKVTKGQALEWCLKRGFEFIELYPTTEKPGEDDIIPEKYGVDRVIEALHSHTWSNLVMKSKKNSNSSNTKVTTKENVDTKNPLSSEHIDDFTDLFSQLQTMKDSLQGMPMNQRKQCAEQMVTAFWKAIGGEEEELLDL